MRLSGAGPVRDARAVTLTPTDVDARLRRLGRAGVVLPLVGGAAHGHVGAAVVDLLTTVEWRGAWTGAAMGGGAAIALGVLAWLVKSGRTHERGGAPGGPWGVVAAIFYRPAGFRVSASRRPTGWSTPGPRWRRPTRTG